MRLVTKYYKKDMEKYYLQGQLRFGTLIGYGQGDKAKLARMRDREGVSITSYEVGRGRLEKLDLGGIRYNNLFAPTGTTIRTHRRFNDWVWCASIGSYDSDHHRAMLHGSGSYEGDAELTNYAVFDMDRLGNALNECLRQLPEFNVRWENSSNSYLSVAEVTYGVDRENVKTLLGAGPKANDSISEMEYFNTVFGKPAIFSIENEVRVLARLNLPDMAPKEAPPIFPKSQKIRDSIITMGEFEQA